MAKNASNSLFLLVCTVYLGLNSFLFFVQNQTVTGQMSDIYLGGSLISGLLAVVAALYMMMEDTGVDSTSADVTVPIINLCVPKWFFYIMLYVAVGVRLVLAYQSNHNTTGAESVWGYVWIVASLIIALGVWPNAAAYFRARGRISQEKREAAEDAKAEEAAARKARREALK